MAARPVPSSLYQMQQPAHQRPVYQSLYCYLMVCGFNVAIKGLRMLLHSAGVTFGRFSAGRSLRGISSGGGYGHLANRPLYMNPFNTCFLGLSSSVKQDHPLDTSTARLTIYCFTPAYQAPVIQS